MRLGIDIGGSFVKMALYDADFQAIAKSSEAFIADTLQPLHPIARILAQADAILKDNGANLQSVGICVPGSISNETGMVIDAHNLGFHDLPIRALFASHFEVPIYIANDADAATMAEWKLGALRGCEHAMLVTLGTGVGGGLILNGRLFTGGRGNGTEPGHMILHTGGRACSCENNGCAEAYCAATRLCKDGNTNEAKDLFDKAAQGDEKAQAFLDAYIDDLGSYLASIVNLLDLQRIAIGGGVCNAGMQLFVPLQKNMERKCFFRTCTPIVRAQFGNEAGTLGAALLGL